MCPRINPIYNSLGLGLQGLYSATNCTHNILGRFTIILQNQIARVDSFTNLGFASMIQVHHIT